jgi:hypothetical protein
MDFSELLSFRKMITPTIIQILFWIIAGLSILAGLVMIIGGIAMRGGAGLAFMGLLYIFIGPILIRVYCELVRKAIAGPGGASTGFPVLPAEPLVNPPTL